MNLRASFKKISAVLLTIALINFAATAQDDDDNDDVKPHIGIKGGVTFANLVNEGDNVTDKNAKVGYNVGLFAKLPISSHFAIQPELLLISKGARRTYDMGSGFFGIGTGEGELDFNLTYLEVPVLAVVNFNRYINVNAGVYAAYLLNANVTNDSENSNYDKYRDLNEDNFQRFDYGLAAGVGIDLHPVTFGARYEYSLRNLGKSGLSGEITEDSRNSALSLYVGLGF